MNDQVSSKPLKYRFYLEVPKFINLKDKVFALGKKYNIDVDFLGEEKGVVRKTVFFMAYGTDWREVQEFRNQVDKLNGGNK